MLSPDRFVMDLRWPVSSLQLFLRSPAQTVRDMGGNVYSLLFVEFPSVFNRQEVRIRWHCRHWRPLVEGRALVNLHAVVFRENHQILGAIMAHTGSKDAAEVDSALSVLQRLTRTLDDAVKLAPFLPFLKGALDFIDSLKLGQVGYPFDGSCDWVERLSDAWIVCFDHVRWVPQIRIVYNTICAVIFGKQAVDRGGLAVSVRFAVPCCCWWIACSLGSVFWFCPGSATGARLHDLDEIYILLRKQLAHTSQTYVPATGHLHRRARGAGRVESVATLCPGFTHRTLMCDRTGLSALASSVP